MASLNTVSAFNRLEHDLTVIGKFMIIVMKSYLAVELNAVC
jgi:hypothetical protein